MAARKTYETNQILGLLRIQPENMTNLHERFRVVTCPLIVISAIWESTKAWERGDCRNAGEVMD